MTEQKEELFLSKSSIESYIQCPAKFDFRYNKGLRPDQSSNEAALFGNVIHSVLENYFKGGKKDDLIALYKEEFKKSDIVSQKFYFLGDTLLSNYAKDVDNGNKVLALEEGFKLYLDNGVPVKGFIDRIDQISEDEIEIIDYKTGYSLPLTEEDLKNDIQLGIYNLAANQLFPQYKKVKLSLYYLHYGKVSCYRTEEQLGSLKSYLEVVYNKITSSVKEGLEFKPIVNSYCSFCDFKKDCPEFNKVIRVDSDADDMDKSFQGLISKEMGLTVDIDKLDLFLKTVQAKEKILSKVEDDIKSFIKKYIEENGKGETSVKIGNTTFYLANKKYTNYDVAQVVRICEENGIDFSNLLSARKGEIDKTFKAKPKVMEKLRTKASTSYSESYVK